MDDGLAVEAVGPVITEIAEESLAVLVGIQRGPIIAAKPRAIIPSELHRHPTTRLIGPYGVRIDNLLSISRSFDRGRKDRLSSVPPPSEPCMRISRTRLSSQWFYLEED